MAVVILNGQDTTKLVADVNGYRAMGFVPACGLSYRNGTFYQPMITGDSTVPYGIIDSTTDVAFQNGANWASENLGAKALGEILNVNGRFVQAFGDGVSPESSAEFRDEVLAVVNDATVGDPDYAGLTTYVTAIINSTGALAEDAPEVAGLRQFIQAVIDAQP